MLLLLTFIQCYIVKKCVSQRSGNFILMVLETPEANRINIELENDHMIICI